MSSRRSGSLMAMREVETSPDGRYIRLDDKLGSGAYKDVWRAFDTETGREVAWNTIDLTGLPDHEKDRVRSETMILSRLSHPNVIEFLSSWDSVGNRHELCFATEIVNSGTLKQYVARVRGIKLKVIKSWCRQILNALNYLHHLNPPIIHRDVKCDNIFIQGSTSKVILGDFGLASSLYRSHAESVLGTPEFMAPELYEQDYTESVDVYSFGMCVLEMVTKEYPFEECSNAPQIWKRVSGGGKPQVLQRIQHRQVREFIEICLAKQELRLTAEELLQHPFLDFEKSDPILDDQVVKVEDRSEKDQEKVKAAEQCKREERDKAKRLAMDKMEKERDIEREKRNGGENVHPSVFQHKPVVIPLSSSSSSSMTQSSSLSSLNNTVHIPAGADISFAPSTPSSSLSIYGYSSTPTPTPPASPYNQLMVETTPASTPTAAGERSGTPAQMMHSMMGQQHQIQQQHPLFTYTTTQGQPQSRLSTSNSSGNLSSFSSSSSSLSSSSSIASPPAVSPYSNYHNSIQQHQQQSHEGIAPTYHHDHHYNAHLPRQPSHHHVLFPHPHTPQHTQPPQQQQGSTHYPHQLAPSSASQQQQQQQQPLTSSRSVPHLSSHQFHSPALFPGSHSSIPLHAPCPTRPIASPTLSAPGSIPSSTPEAIVSVPPPSQTQSQSQVHGSGSSIQFEIESFNPATGIAHVNLHLQLSNRKKKQIKFEFSLSKDTASLIASEMVRALKLEDGEQMEKVIAQAMEGKLGAIRKQWDRERQQQQQGQNQSQQQVQQQPRPTYPGQQQQQWSQTQSQPTTPQNGRIRRSPSPGSGLHKNKPPQQQPNQPHSQHDQLQHPHQIGHQQQQSLQPGQPIPSHHHHHHHHPPHHHHHQQQHHGQSQSQPHSPSQPQPPQLPIPGPIQPSHRSQASSQHSHATHHNRSNSTHLPAGASPSSVLSNRSSAQVVSASGNGNGNDQLEHQQQQPPPPSPPLPPHHHHPQLHHPPSHQSPSHQSTSVSSLHYPPFHHYPGPITSHPIHPSSHSNIGSNAYTFSHGPLASKGQGQGQPHGQTNASPSCQARKSSPSGPAQPNSQTQGTAPVQMIHQPPPSSLKSHINTSTSHPSSHSSSHATPSHPPIHPPLTSTTTRLSQPLPQHQPQFQPQSQPPASSPTSIRILNPAASSTSQQHQHHQQLSSHHGQGNAGYVGAGSASLPHSQTPPAVSHKAAAIKSDGQQFAHQYQQQFLPHSHPISCLPGSKLISGMEGHQITAADAVNGGVSSVPQPSIRTIPTTAMVKPTVRRHDTGDSMISAPATLDGSLRRSNSAHSLTNSVSSNQQPQTPPGLQFQQTQQHASSKSNQQQQLQPLSSLRPSSVSPTKPAAGCVAPVPLLPINPKTKEIALAVPASASFSCSSFFCSSAPSAAAASPLPSVAPNPSVAAFAPGLSCSCCANVSSTVPSLPLSSSSAPAPPPSLLSPSTLTIPSYLDSIPITTPSISSGTSVSGETMDSRSSSQYTSSFSVPTSPTEIHSPPTLMPITVYKCATMAYSTVQLNPSFSSSLSSQPHIPSPLHLPLLSSSSSSAASAATNPNPSSSIITAGSSAITSVGAALAAVQQIKLISENANGTQGPVQSKVTRTPAPVPAPVAVTGSVLSSSPQFLSSLIPPSSSVPLPHHHLHPHSLPFISSSSFTSASPPAAPALSISTILPKPPPLLKAVSVPLVTAAVSSSTLGALAASHKRRGSSPSPYSPSPPLRFRSPVVGRSASATASGSTSPSPSPSPSPVSSRSPSMTPSPSWLLSSPPLTLSSVSVTSGVGSVSVTSGVGSPLPSSSVRSCSPLVFSLGRRASSPSLSIVRSPILHSAASVFIPPAVTPLPKQIIPTSTATLPVQHQLSGERESANEFEVASTTEKNSTSVTPTVVVGKSSRTSVPSPSHSHALSSFSALPLISFPASDSVPVITPASSSASVPVASNNLLQRRSLSPIAFSSVSIDYADDSDKAESSKSPLSEFNLVMENTGGRGQRRKQGTQETEEKEREQHGGGNAKIGEEGGQSWNSKQEAPANPDQEQDQSKIPQVVHK